jgi:NTP pyrophosphatase (non-canonical NTP hydrolase)
VKERIEVQDAEIAAAFAILGKELQKRLGKHGKLSFIGPHEILGIIEEEMHELREAVRSNKNASVLSELMDVAVGALFGVASLAAIERVQNKKEVVQGQ